MIIFYYFVLTKFGSSAIICSSFYDRARGTEMIDSQTATLADFLPAYSPCPGRPSFAELTAHLSDCLGFPVEDLEVILSVSEPESLAIYLAGDHAAAVKLRNTLNLDPEKIEPGPIAEALALPTGYICAALFAALDRMSSIALDPEMVVIARMRHAKRSLLAAWRQAIEFAAPHGFISADDAYEIGIGETVYAAMLAQCGKSEIEALSREEFLTLAPKLIEFWPISEEGLACLSNLLWETEAFIELHLDAQFMEMSKESAALSSGC